MVKIGIMAGIYPAPGETEQPETALLLDNSRSHLDTFPSQLSALRYHMRGFSHRSALTFLDRTGGGLVDRPYPQGCRIRKSYIGPGACSIKKVKRLFI